MRDWSAGGEGAQGPLLRGCGGLGAIRGFFVQERFPISCLTSRCLVRWEFAYASELDPVDCA
jgi:hypothetical protein